MEKEVSVFKVIMLFILNIILFSIIDLIGYYIIMFIFNILMNNVSIFYNIFIMSIPYILFTIIYSASLGKWSIIFTISIVTLISKNEENNRRSFLGSGISLITISIISFILGIMNGHISFDVSYLVGGFILFLSGKKNI